MKTPEQIADTELRADDNWTQTSDPVVVRGMLIRAVETDRAQHPHREYLVEIRPTDTGERVIKRYDSGDVYYVDTLAEDWVDEDPDLIEDDDDEARAILDDAMRRLGGDDE